VGKDVSKNNEKNPYTVVFFFFFFFFVYFINVPSPIAERQPGARGGTWAALRYCNLINISSIQ